MNIKTRLAALDQALQAHDQKMINLWLKGLTDDQRHQIQDALGQYVTPRWFTPDQVNSMIQGVLADQRFLWFILKVARRHALDGHLDEPPDDLEDTMNKSRHNPGGWMEPIPWTEEYAALVHFHCELGNIAQQARQKGLIKDDH